MRSIFSAELSRVACLAVALGIFCTAASALGEKVGEKKEYKVIEPDAENLPLPVERMHHFVDSIVTRRKPICTTQQALAVQKILDAIYESSKTGREVRIK